VSISSTRETETIYTAVSKFTLPESTASDIRYDILCPLYPAQRFVLDNN